MGFCKFKFDLLFKDILVVWFLDVNDMIDVVYLVIFNIF